MLKRTLVTAIAVALLIPAAALAKTKTLHYKGKTKEGTKISFIVKKGWVDQFSTGLPFTCISAQGGTPLVGIEQWTIPYKYKLGYKAKVDYGDPTEHYHIETHRKKGNRVVGKLSINWSRLDYSWGSGYFIRHCLATGSFSLKPKK
jgi:hypothetical protein